MPQDILYINLNPSGVESPDVYIICILYIAIYAQLKFMRPDTSSPPRVCSVGLVHHYVNL